MKYNLKYIVPILVFIIGSTVMSVNTYFYAQSEHERKIESIIERTLIIGNRITNEIEHQKLYGDKSFEELSRIFSKYTLEYLNIAKIYDNNINVIFSSTPSKLYCNGIYISKETIKEVIKTRKPYIVYSEDSMGVDAIFLLKNYGALYLQFDMSTQHKKLMENIYKYALVNGLVILLMVIVLAVLLYFLILRRLNNLYKMTVEVSNGNYDVRVDSCLNDELSEVNNAFNDMVEKISKHQLELEIKVEEAVIKNEEQSRIMMQQNRLISMGEMINNIAHQWRQPLNTLGLILQKFELFHKRGVLSEEKLVQNIEKGMIQIDKMSTTIDDFRNFFKKDKEKQIFYIKELVEEVSLFLENTLLAFNIRLEIDVEPSTEMSGYKNEFTQVLINLVNNAKDALVANKESDRWIGIRCRVANENMIMEIQDNAGGVPSHIIEKVFDPYFTTKEEGKGTGIGLYMSKTIIEENMGGKLKVHNSQEGAVFTIELSLNDVHPFCEIYCET